MIMLLDTSTPVCRLTLSQDDWQYHDEWEAGRDLARGLLGYVEEQLRGQGRQWSDLTGLVAFKGPGSFTGLRIGITVLNSLAYARGIPIVGTMGDNWRTDGLRRLEAGENDEIVMPEYGGEANITQPRK